MSAVLTGGISISVNESASNSAQITAYIPDSMRNPCPFKKQPCDHILSVCAHAGLSGQKIFNSRQITRAIFIHKKGKLK